jgi:putative membrane protein
MSTDAAKPDSTQLALDRTWLAHERTLMAWVRTATSMISFAFTIFKLFQFEAQRGTPLAHGLITPRDFALILVSIALVTLFMAIISHHRQTRSIVVHLPGRRSMAELVAALVSLFGLAVLLSALFHW